MVSAAFDKKAVVDMSCSTQVVRFRDLGDVAQEIDIVRIDIERGDGIFVDAFSMAYTDMLQEGAAAVFEMFRRARVAGNFDHLVYLRGAERHALTIKTLAAALTYLAPVENEVDCIGLLRVQIVKRPFRDPVAIVPFMMLTQELAALSHGLDLRKFLPLFMEGQELSTSTRHRTDSSSCNYTCDTERALMTQRGEACVQEVVPRPENMIDAFEADTIPTTSSIGSFSDGEDAIDDYIGSNQGGVSPLASRVPSRLLENGEPSGGISTCDTFHEKVDIEDDLSSWQVI